MISSYAFYKCSKLKTISFESGSKLTIIEENAFQYSGLESINIPASVINIGDAVFKDCIYLRNVNFEKNSQLKNLGNEVFYRSSSLTKINIPAGVSIIGKNTFRGTTSLETINFDSKSFQKLFAFSILIPMPTSAERAC